MSKKDLQTLAAERAIAITVKAVDKLRQQFQVGFMQEQMTKAETRRHLQRATPQQRLDMYNALGPDEFFKQLGDLGMLDEEVPTDVHA